MSAWYCDACAFKNPAKNSLCKLCDSQHLLLVLEAQIAEDPDVDAWYCGTCTFKNPARNSVCEMCDSKHLVLEAHVAEDSGIISPPELE